MAAPALPQARARRIVPSAIRGGLCGVAVLLGGSTLLGILTGDAALWASPLVLGARSWGVLTGAGWLFLARHLIRPLPLRSRRLLAVVLLLFCLSALRDTLGYFALVTEGEISTARRLPASAAMLILGTAGLLATRSTAPGPHGWREWGAGSLGGCAAGLATLLCAMLAFGATDYRRPADCIVVLGAGVSADGTPSRSLRDRVAEGVKLYEEGYADWLIMSGGIDPAHGQSEPGAMLRLALEASVPPERILLDEEGVDTRSSARACAALFEARGWSTALVVSHGYHLLRAKSAFRREGIEAFTVPATESRRLVREPYYVLRECAAWLFYALPS